MLASLLYSFGDTVQNVLANVTAAKMPSHGQAVPHVNSRAKPSLPEEQVRLEQEEESQILFTYCEEPYHWFHVLLKSSVFGGWKATSGNVYCASDVNACDCAPG